VLNDAWVCSDIGITSGSTVKSALKDSDKPMLHIDCPFNEYDVMGVLCMMTCEWTYSAWQIVQVLWNFTRSDNLRCSLVLRYRMPSRNVQSNCGLQCPIRTSTKPLFFAWLLWPINKKGLMSLITFAVYKTTQFYFADKIFFKDWLENLIFHISYP